MELTEKQKDIVREKNKQRAALRLPPMNENQITELLDASTLITRPDVNVDGETKLKNLAVMERLDGQSHMTPEDREKYNTMHKEKRLLQEQERQLGHLKYLTHKGEITSTQYLQRRDVLLEKFKRGDDSQPLFESNSPAEKRRKLWELRYKGKITLEECLDQCAEIRLAEEQSRLAIARRQRQLLTESGRTKFQILAESKSDGLLKIRGTLSISNCKNGNGRIYPRDLWRKQIEKLQPLLGDRKVIGAADHPPDGITKLTDACVLWEKIWLDKDGVTTLGEGAVLNTAKGRDLQALIRAGVPVDVSSRGFGTLTRKNYESQGMADVAEDDYELATFDVLFGGSVPEASISAA